MSLISTSLVIAIALFPTSGALGAALSAPGRTPALAPIPVILCTDIGDDIDDTWALVMLLKSPELDLRLVVTTYGKADYRARIVAKILTVAGRTDVPVGLGAGGCDGAGGQEAWIRDFPLAGYAGKVRKDGARAVLEEIRNSPRPVTLIDIGPSTTVAEALRLDPTIAPKTSFVGMQGSVRKGYDGGAAGPEWNVKADVPAARATLLAPWRRTIITPLDTCGLVRLGGETFRTVRGNPDPLVRALMENYRLWAKKGSLEELAESSVLFDTVAVYLAFPGPKPLLSMEDLALSVADDGMTRIDPSGARMSVATSWTDLGEYGRMLARRLGGRKP
jgi:inosine-uridine nucleoside N-ribohydrolase